MASASTASCLPLLLCLLLACALLEMLSCCSLAASVLSPAPYLPPALARTACVLPLPLPQPDRPVPQGLRQPAHRRLRRVHREPLPVSGACRPACLQRSAAVLCLRLPGGMTLPGHLPNTASLHVLPLLACSRCPRFALEVVKAVTEEVGAHKVGIRLSPFGGFLSATDSHPYALTTYLLEELNK